MAHVLETEGGLEISKWGETKDHQGFLDRTFEGMRVGHIGWLICENFYPTGGVKTWQPDALHQIGVLRWQAAHWNVPIYMQRVADAEDFATQKKMAPFISDRSGPLVGKGGRGHARMALKHLIRWRWVSYNG
jgi:hypothetical protein